MKPHPVDARIQAEWEGHMKNVNRLFEASPMKGSKYEATALLCIVAALVPDRFKWEAIERQGDRLPNIVLLGYCPELHEVLSEEHQREFSVGSQQTAKVTKRNVN